MTSHRTPRSGPIVTENLASLPDIGPASIAWLRAIGIETVSGLRRLGPAEAYARIAYRFGSAVNRNVLYAMAMGPQGRKYNSATDAEKRALCEEVGIPFPRR